MEAIICESGICRLGAPTGVGIILVNVKDLMLSCLLRGSMVCQDGRGFGTAQTGFKSNLSHLEKLLKSSEPHFLYL